MFQFNTSDQRSDAAVKARVTGADAAIVIQTTQVTVNCAHCEPSDGERRGGGLRTRRGLLLCNGTHSMTQREINNDNCCCWRVQRHTGSIVWAAWIQYQSESTEGRHGTSFSEMWSLFLIIIILMCLRALRAFWGVWSHTDLLLHGIIVYYETTLSTSSVYFITNSSKPPRPSRKFPSLNLLLTLLSLTTAHPKGAGRQGRQEAFPQV